MESFKFKIIEDVTIIKIDLVVATLRDAQPFWEEIEKRLILDREKIIIDLSSCTYIDSTFTGIIIRLFRRLNEKRNQLKLVYHQKDTIINFWALGISKFIECFDTLPEAADSFYPTFIKWGANFDEKLHRN